MPGVLKKQSRVHSNSGAHLLSPSTDGSQSQIQDSSMIGSEGAEMLSPNASSLPNVSTGMKKKRVKETPVSSRRTSSRVRAQPAYFDASPITAFTSPIKSQATPSSVSKSSSIKSTDRDDESGGGNETLVDESEDVDEEVTFKKPPMPNRRRSKGTLNITVKKGKTRKSVTEVVNQEQEEREEDESSLFYIVKDGKTALMSVVHDWIDSYNEDKLAAMTDLIQFFVHCSGCKAVVSKAMIDNEDTVQAIRHLTENFGESAEEYPLIITRPEFKRFKSSFSQFLSHLINLCQHNVIYDGDMIDILICWIIGLSDSQVRAFRHTSTYAGMKIVTGVIDVALKVSIELDNIQRQLDGENLKSAGKKSREKVEKLQKRREELRQNKDDLEEMMNRIFTGIFMHRYRDVRPEIRSICIAELGLWMDKYHSHFLDQNYLKYLGWMLYDKIGEVRLEVLKALEKLYSNEDYAENLELFTSRFKNRLIHMTLDIDTEVAVQAIKIATLLYKYDILEEDDCSQVEQLVFCDQRRMAHAAGEFLALRITRLSMEASPKKIKKGNKEEYLREMNIKAILDFFIKTEIHEHCAYIADSLWEHTDLLKDWKTMTNLLLDMNSLIELEDVEEAALIDLMCCSCKQAATGIPPPGRSAYKKQSQREKKMLADDKLSLSTHFMEHLPTLIEKYKADVPKVTKLLEVPQYFNLQIYPEKRLTKHLESLLEHMEDIIMKHADINLLDTCAQTYHYLMDNELTIKQTIEVSRNRVIDEMVEKFRKSIAHGVPNDQDDKESQSYFQIVSSLKRLKTFNKVHNMSDWGLYEDIHAIIGQGISGSIDEEILILSMNIMFMTLLMDMDNILSVEEPEKFIWSHIFPTRNAEDTCAYQGVELKKLRKRQKAFVKQLDEFLQFSNVTVKTEVFKILCDFFIYFSKKLANKKPQYAQIVCSAEPVMQVRMRDFVIANVFNSVENDAEDDEEEDDNKAKELYDKRILLTGLCKLIAFQIFDVKLAAPIYTQFLKTYANYSDIIKHLTKECRQVNVIAHTKVLLFALEQAFESLRDDNEGHIDTRSKEFSDIKDLAHRFALTLGFDSSSDSCRKSTIIMHREGITYAFSYPLDPSISPSKQNMPDVPPNLLFLEILQEFTFRVIDVDKKVILSHLDETAGDLLKNTGTGWQPMHTYKTGVESRTSAETRVGEEADGELEDVPAVEVGKKKRRSISFANDTKLGPAPSKQKVKKKLSLSKVTVGGESKWLSKKTIESENENNSLNVAKPIPKVTLVKKRKKSWTPKKKATQSYSKESYNEISSPEKSRNKKNTPKKYPGRAPKKSVAKSPVGRTKTPGKSPRNGVSQENVIEESAKKTIVTKAAKGKKGAVAITPVRLSASINSPASSRGSGRKRRNEEESPMVAEEEDPSDSNDDSNVEYTSELSGSSADSSQSGTGKSWLATQQRVSGKKPRKSYDMRPILSPVSPLKMTIKRTRSRVDDSQQDSPSDVSQQSFSSSPSARELRASKRQKRESATDS